jgi:hypothetical protein
MAERRNQLQASKLVFRRTATPQKGNASAAQEIFRNSKEQNRKAVSAPDKIPPELCYRSLQRILPLIYHRRLLFATAFNRTLSKTLNSVALVNIAKD